MRIYVICWQGPAATTYTTECYSPTAKEALAMFRREIAILQGRKVCGSDKVTITGIYDSSWGNDYMNGGSGVYMQLVEA